MTSAFARTLARRRHWSCVIGFLRATVVRKPFSMTSRTQAEPPASPKGVYANYFEVGHTAFEFVLDFGQRYGTVAAPCHTRIVTSPVYAQALLETLRESLEQYVAAFGPLRGPTDDPSSGR